MQSPPQHRILSLFKEEAERSKLCQQCSPHANPLYADFRFDHVYQVYEYFSKKGLNFRDLFTWQENIPIIYPWNLEYDSLRQNVNRRYNIFPMMIIMAETDEHVEIALHLAKKYNIPIRLRAGGHSFESQSISEGMVIDQSRRKKLKIVWENEDYSLNNDSEDVTDQTIRASSYYSNDEKIKIPYAYIEAGALLGPIADQLARKGLVMISGSCPNNGATGFLLGGGIGFLSRRYGLGSDSLTAVKILLANGKTIVADKDKYSDLLWTARGAGGGNFGIVTGMKVRLYPITKVTVIKYTFKFEQVKKVLKAWQEWFPTSSNRFMTQVSLFNNSSDVHLQGIYLGSPIKAKTELDNILYGIKIENQIIKCMDYLDSALFFGGTARWLLNFKAKSAMIPKPLSDLALDIIEKRMKEGDGTDIFEITNLGGRIGEISNDKTAFAHRDAFAWMMINSHWSTQKQTDEKLKWTRDFYHELLPHLTDKPLRVYANTPDLDIENYLEAYYGDNLEKLKIIKKKYDPHNIFNYDQSIPTDK
jgi:FAD/FMN-containing dehydrogenase